MIKLLMLRHELNKPWQLMGATGLYKPVGGTGSSFCMILNSMLHITDPFFTKLRNNFK